jgi:hypothetical protein
METLKVGDIPEIPPPYDGGQPTAYGLAKLFAAALVATGRMAAQLHPNRARVDVTGERPDGSKAHYVVLVEWAGVERGEIPPRSSRKTPPEL